MSLLMDALRRAEEAKLKVGSTTPSPASNQPPTELSLDPLELTAPEPERTLPPLARHLEALDADLAAAAAASPIRRPPAADVKPTSEAIQRAEASDQRETARKVFAAKQPAGARPALWPILGLLAAFAVIIGGYFWWQLQALDGTPPTPAPAPPASAPVLPGAALGEAPPAAPTAVPTGAPTAPLAGTPSTAAPALPPPAEIAPPPVRPPPAAVPTASAPLGAISKDSEKDREKERDKDPSPPRAASVRLHPSLPRPTEQVETMLALAYEAWLANRVDDAQRGYEQVLRTDRKNSDALLGLAAIALRRGQNERAHELYLRVVESDPSDATAQAALVNLRGAGDSGQTESRLKTLLASQPDSPALHFALGNHYARSGRWSDAQQAYFDACRLDPDNADHLYNLAVSLDHLRQGKLAAQYYGMALVAADKQPSAFDKSLAARRIQELQP
ncbi:tetratricopeptide repeat protein [Accumulibacter sp.]|uniref:tetratricopeptide repeat protein n=1 Tax=Accumulibacter sp. TaxID=2053492 RepID=UPI002B57F518|nr:tetratricopeptide repeat protein [Accumulibacter sp.]HND38007.1 tetratricopeptide repeat protein [Accumulibacter sp.]HNE39152.1 tetratricopeptide repeat protein [Accumulibacter sp.]